MRLQITPRFERQFEESPESVKSAVEKQLRFLLANPRHPSLDVHAYPPLDALVPPGRRAWQVDVTRGAWRMYYWTEGDTYVFFQLMKHPKKGRQR
jgi:hypothetical protein